MTWKTLFSLCESGLIHSAEETRSLKEISVPKLRRKRKDKSVYHSCSSSIHSRIHWLRWTLKCQNSSVFRRMMTANSSLLTWRWQLPVAWYGTGPQCKVPAAAVLSHYLSLKKNPRTDLNREKQVIRLEKVVLLWQTQQSWI